MKINFYQASKINEIRNVKCNVSCLVSISSILQISKDATFIVYNILFAALYVLVAWKITLVIQVCQKPLSTKYMANSLHFFNQLTNQLFQFRSQITRVAKLKCGRVKWNNALSNASFYQLIICKRSSEVSESNSVWFVQWDFNPIWRGWSYTPYLKRGGDKFVLHPKKTKSSEKKW